MKCCDVKRGAYASQKNGDRLLKKRMNKNCDKSPFQGRCISQLKLMKMLIEMMNNDCY